ncbi:MAG: HNH endonuclease [Nitrosomonas sp.]|nr:HNH endonuclease [Nitrosomonas sp.]
MNLTQDILKKNLHYDPESGIFIRLISSSNRIKVGQEAGSIYTSRGKKYKTAMLLGKQNTCHRLAWLYMTGSFPEKEIDHINGNGLDNRWANLREVSHLENCKNIRLSDKNRNGIIGINFHKRLNKWQVGISSDTKQLHIGYFDNLFDAACARKSAEKKYGYHPNHGRGIGGSGSAV